MNRKIDNGGPAFPADALGICYGGGDASQGMTLRDWFAGHALMSMLSAPDKINDSTFDKASELSYKFADAMIAARKVKP